MTDKVELAKAIARVESDIFELRVSLSAQKDALIKQGKEAVWNAQRAALTKPLYNLLERRWALDLLKHASKAEALYDVKVIGILLPETMAGSIVPPASRLISTDVMTDNGLMPMRTYDVMQFEAGNPDVQPHELKSDAGKTKKGVMASSVKGGITHPDIEVQLRQKSSPGKQHRTEKKLITEASKVAGAKIVVEGTEAVSGKVIRIHLDPKGLNLSRFSNYTDVPDVLSIGKPDPTDMAPPAADKPAQKKKAQPTKAKKKPAKTPVKPAKKKPKKVIPAGGLADAAEDAAVKAAKKQPTKPKGDPKLTAKRGVTAPSPNAPTDAADDGAGASPKKKQAVKRKVKPPVKVKKSSAPDRAITPPSPNTPQIDPADVGQAADKTLAAEAKDIVPSKTLLTTPPTPPVTTVPVPEKTPTVAPSVPKIEPHPTPSKAKFSLRLKISPKIKAVGGFVLTIGFDLFLGWLEGRRISKMIKALLEENSDKFTEVVNAVATQEDFVKFRYGSKLEKGYQLYFEIKLAVTRHCSDGGCGTSGSIEDIVFKEVTFSRTKGPDFFPDPTEGKGWVDEYGGATAVFYQPIFDEGIPVHAATEHAADDDLTEFYRTFMLRKKQGIGDYTREYYDDFEQYCLFFPNSQAGKLFLGFAFNDYLNDVTKVELARKPASILMAPPHNLPFDEVLKWVRWGLASRMSFIVDFYRLVIQMRPEYAIRYLELYDAYFKEMDDGYKKCDSSCHRMTGDKRIIRRMTADDVRMKDRSLTMLLGTESLIYTGTMTGN